MFVLTNRDVYCERFEEGIYTPLAGVCGATLPGQPSVNNLAWKAADAVTARNTQRSPYGCCFLATICGHDIGIAPSGRESKILGETGRELRV